MQPALFDTESEEATFWSETGFDRCSGMWFAQVLYGHPGVEVLGGVRRPARSEVEAAALVPELTWLVRARFNGGANEA